MTNSEPLPTADPADLAEQTTPVDDTATDDEDAAMDAADAPLDTNPATNTRPWNFPNRTTPTSELRSESRLSCLI